MGNARGMCGTLDADLKVQRTIKRVEFTASLCILTKITRSTAAHVDNKSIIDGFWGGRKEGYRPNNKSCRVGSNSQKKWSQTTTTAHVTEGGVIFPSCFPGWVARAARLPNGRGGDHRHVGNFSTATTGFKLRFNTPAKRHCDIPCVTVRKVSPRSLTWALWIVRSEHRNFVRCECEKPWKPNTS